jgi:DNA polymerase-3 subunit delta
VEKGKLNPIYFLNGNEEYLKTEFLRLMRRKLFGDLQASASVEKVSAVAGSAPGIIDLSSDYSLFSGGRLIVVYDVQRISEAGQQILVSFFPNIPPGNHLVLFGPPSFDRRRKLYKYLTTSAVWSTLKGLSERSAPFWIKRRLSGYNMEISPAALERLMRYVGSSYGLLANQIDKLAIALADKKRLDVEDIDRHTAVAAEYEVFRLLDLIDKGDRPRALEVLHSLLEKSDGIGSVLFWLGRHLSQYYVLAAAPDGRPDSGITRKLGIPPYKISTATEVARNRPTSYYEESIKAITEVEASLRFDHVPHKMLLESLIIQLTSCD